MSPNCLTAFGAHVFMGLLYVWIKFIFLLLICLLSIQLLE